MRTRVMAAALWGICTVAQAGVIDFNPAGAVCNDSPTGNGNITACGNNVYIAQSYGDIAGVLDVQYASANYANTSLRWWNSDYNTLLGVAWADGGDNNSTAHIDLLPLNGQGVILTHFDLGAWPNTHRDSTVTITAIGGPVLYSQLIGVGNQPANTPTSFDGSWSGANGIRIEWKNSAYNNGIDNITYEMGSTSPVPEPATFLMLLVGLVCMGGIGQHVKSEPFE